MTMRALRSRPRGYQGVSVLPDGVRAMLIRRATELGGLALVGFAALAGVALATWSAQDPSFSHATDVSIHNALGAVGAVIADLLTQAFGLAAAAFVLPVGVWGWRLMTQRAVEGEKIKLIAWPLAAALLAGVAGLISAPAAWPLPAGLGGVVGDLFAIIADAVGLSGVFGHIVAGVALASAGLLALALALGLAAPSERAAVKRPTQARRREPEMARPAAARAAPATQAEPDDVYDEEDDDDRRLISLGLLTHWALSAKAAAGRFLARRANRGDRDASGLSGILARASREPDDFRREPGFGHSEDVDLDGAPVIRSTGGLGGAPRQLLGGEDQPSRITRPVGPIRAGPPRRQRGAARPSRARRLRAAAARALGRTQEGRRPLGEPGGARAERPPARRRARGLRRPRQHHQRAARPGRHAL